jgi:drug/metabolite transporter (DMT)-like permease
MRRLSAHQKGVIAVIIANIIWGAAPPVFKFALQDIPPFTLAFIRFLVATLLLFPFVMRMPWIETEDWPALIVTALMGITANVGFLFLGLQKSSSINASIIAAAGPIFLYVLSVFFLHERLRKKVLTGTIISLAGVIFIIAQPIMSHYAPGEITGNLFFLLSTLGAVGHTIVGKRIIYKYHPHSVTFWTFLISSITFLPLCVGELQAANPFLTMDYRGWIGIFFGAILSSFAAYTLYDWGISKIYTQEVGIFSYIDPVVTTLIAVPLLGELVTPIFLVAALFVFGGIYIAEGRLHYHPIHLLKQR